MINNSMRIAEVVAEGKKIYRLNLESIENQFGKLDVLDGGWVRKNQKLLRYMAERDQPAELFFYIIEQKLNSLYGQPLEEAIDSSNKELNTVFDQFNQFSTGNRVKVGDKVVVLNLEAWSYGNTNKIILDGFLAPTIVYSVSPEYAHLETGGPFPKSRVEQISMWRQTIFFHDTDVAKKCLTTMAMLSGKIGIWTLQ
jgi:hypothetical protein